MQHAGGGTVGERLFRDQFRRQIVVELGDQHRSIMPYLNACNVVARAFTESETYCTIEKLGMCTSIGFVA